MSPLGFLAFEDESVIILLVRSRFVLAETLARPAKMIAASFLLMMLGNFF